MLIVDADLEAGALNDAELLVDDATLEEKEIGTQEIEVRGDEEIDRTEVEDVAMRTDLSGTLEIDTEDETLLRKVPTRLHRVWLDTSRNGL